MTDKIRVMLVDDSPLVLKVLSKLIDADPRLEVVATATSGLEALEMIKRAPPDVLCTDVQMPGMDGLTLVKKVMEQNPLPILVVSMSVQPHQEENIFRLLEAGVVDVFPKPRASVRLDATEAKAFCDRVYVVSKVHVFRNHVKSVPTSKPLLTENKPTPLQMARQNRAVIDAVVIGGSTGAPQIYYQLFSQLKPDFCIPIVAVQHISDGFTQTFVDWLDRSTANRVQVAEAGERILPGHIYFPPDSTHLTVREGRIRLDPHSPPNSGSRPSVNVVFESFVQSGRANRTLAVLLSGMGRDGAEGMAALHREGALTVAQSEESCAIFGMPKEAIALNAVDQVLSPEEIVKLLNELC